MTRFVSSVLEDKDLEVGELVVRLHETQQRLQELGGGELDSVLHPGGQSYLLHEAQERLRKSELRYHSLFENMLEGYAYCQTEFDGDVLRDFSYVEVNSSFARLTGLQDVIGRKVTYVLPGIRESNPELFAFYGKVALTGESAKLEFHVAALSLWLSLTVYSTERGHFVAIFDNITERKKAEADLRFNEMRYRSLVEATTSIVWNTPPSGELGTDQAAWGAFTGQSSEEYKGRGWLAAIHPEDQEETERVWNQAVASRSIYKVEHRLKARDQSYRNMVVQGVPIIAEDGTILQWIGVHTDVTERKESEARIAEQAALIDQARDAIFLRDMQHRVTFWSQGAERIFGWTAAEAMGRSVFDLLHPDPIIFEQALKVVLDRGAWNGVTEKATKAHETLTLESRWTLVRNAAGDPRSILVIDTDITERKRIEDQLHRAQRMESIGTLAGGIAHDLNNSLAPIIMALEMLSTKFPDPDSQELLGIISASAHRGAAMVRQVLSFARGVEGQRLEVQIRHLVHDVEQIVTDTFLKDIQLRTRVPNNLWTVLGDSTQLHQVLLNLCVNARDAMPDGGRLTISAENLVLDAQYAGLNPEAQPGAYVVVKVEDCGTGIQPAVLEKIFDPFFTTKEVGKGTGLGLSSAMAIVKSHGGFLRVYSEVGKGTKFSVYLPGLTESLPAEVTVNAPEVPHGRGELILVVDDEESVRQVTQLTLESYGYQVLLATDGADAIALYAGRGREIAVVLTDMTMPILDGPATIRVLRKLNPKVQVIGTSGLSVDRGPDYATSNGMDDFLLKPYTASNLLTALRRVCDKCVEA